MWLDCVVGRCVGRAVPPDGPQAGGGISSSERKKGPDLPNRAEVHKRSASQPLLATTLLYYSVHCTEHQCVLSHTYIYTHTPRLLA